MAAEVLPEMLVTTVNSGSTSVKLAAFAGDGPQTLELRQREQHAVGASQAAETLRGFLARLGAMPATVAHRVVHGGARLVRPVAVTAEVEHDLQELCALAPLHNPVALQWIDAARSVCSAQVRQIAVFDTAFFAALPRVAREYALPAESGAAIGVRRYGFHGLAHEALWRRWRALQPERDYHGRVISLQLGGGCSIAAVEDGRPLDTSMGFSPLEGLVMATRAGDADPAIVPYLAQRLGCSPEAIIELLNKRSGLLGVSGRSSDLRELLADDSESARFAVELYCYRARKYAAAYLGVLGGCDAVLFGGGVGEHMPEIRARILEPLRWLGIELDAAANAAARGQESRISSAASRIAVQVIPVDEEHTLATAAAEYG